MRLEAGVRPADVAWFGRLDQSTIYRFESEEESWPRNADAIVDCYARALEVGREAIWLRAAELMAAATDRSVTTPEGPGIGRSSDGLPARLSRSRSAA